MRDLERAAESEVMKLAVQGEIGQPSSAEQKRSVLERHLPAGAPALAPGPLVTTGGDVIGEHDDVVPPSSSCAARRASSRVRPRAMNAAVASSR